MTAKIISIFSKSILVLFVFLTGLTSYASEGHETHEEHDEKFNAGEMIIHHLGSTHDIHIIGEFAIPLPVILVTDRGIDMFMSNKFWDEHHHANSTYTSSNGFTYVDHHNFLEITEIDGKPIAHELEVIAEKQKNVDKEGKLLVALTEEEVKLLSTIKMYDFSITKSIFGMLMIMSFMIFIFFKVAKAYKKNPGKAPSGLQNLMEALVLFVKDDIVVPSVGVKKARKFLPFLLTVFFFIWMSNMLGLIPFIGGFNITGSIWITLVLAASVFIITMINGNKHYWGHLLNPPGVPFVIKYVILVPIEIIQIFMKPLVLFIRLTANIAAGHIIILAFVSLILIFGEMSVGVGFGVAAGSVIFMILMFAIELLVAFLQAYVFTLLAALYFGDATQEAHH